MRRLPSFVEPDLTFTVPLALPAEGDGTLLFNQLSFRPSWKPRAKRTGSHVPTLRLNLPAAEA
jgi:hypothetical protein